MKFFIYTYGHTYMFITYMMKTLLKFSKFQIKIYHIYYTPIGFVSTIDTYLIKVKKTWCGGWGIISFKCVCVNWIGHTQPEYSFLYIRNLQTQLWKTFFFFVKINFLKLCVRNRIVKFTKVILLSKTDF